MTTSKYDAILICSSLGGITQFKLRIELTSSDFIVKSWTVKKVLKTSGEEIILAGSKPGTTTDTVTVQGKEMELKILNGPESVVKFDVYPATLTVDRGYDYDRVIRGEFADEKN